MSKLRDDDVIIIAELRYCAPIGGVGIKIKTSMGTNRPIDMLITVPSWSNDVHWLFYCFCAAIKSPRWHYEILLLTQPPGCRCRLIAARWPWLNLPPGVIPHCWGLSDHRPKHHWALSPWADEPSNNTRKDGLVTYQLNGHTMIWSHFHEIARKNVFSCSQTNAIKVVSFPVSE